MKTFGYQNSRIVHKTLHKRSTNSRLQNVVYGGYLPPIELYLTKEFIGISRGYSWPEENIHLKFDTLAFIEVVPLFKHNHRTYAMHKTAYTCV